MKDIQSSKDKRGIAIQKVGINDAHLPFLIKTKDGAFQQVLAKIKFTVDLPMEYKGTHMSRFLEILSDWNKQPISQPEMNRILDDALGKLDAQSAHLKIDFKYFIDKTAPVSKRKSVLDLDCSFTAEKAAGEKMKFTLGVNVPFTSLCPCSKEISKYGAHNQRGLMKVLIQYEEDAGDIYIEDLAAMMEAQGSCPIYPLLKRDDEKYVTETAYENPKFVEDILRDLVLALRKIEKITWFSIECENYESIHNHSAYASHVEFVEH
mgnify:CR=1 FL=1